MRQHPNLLGIPLAQTLKDRAYAVWNSDPARATHAAAALAALARISSHAEVQALAAWVAGIAALAEGRMEAAITALDAAAAQFRTLDQPQTAASTQVGKLMALAMLGRYEDAIACGLSARDVLLAHGDTAAVGRIELNLGNIALRRDQYAAAEVHYRAAYARFASTDEPALLAGIESGLAEVLTRRRQFAEARTLYEQALQRAAAAGLEIVQAEAECNLGNLALNEGRYDQALAYLERSRRRYVALEMAHESAYADLELAEAYLELNLVPEAAAIFSRVIPLFDDLGMRAEHAWALAHLGQTTLRLGDHAAARHHFASAQQILAREGSTVSAALVTLFESQLAYSEGQYERASVAAAHAEAVFVSAGNRSRTLLARWLRGESLRAAGDLDAALPLLTQTLHDAETASAPQIAQRCATALGLLAAAQGDTRSAEAQLTRAVEMIETLRAPLPAEEFRTAFFAANLSPYSELVRICLNDNRIIDALQYVERGRSRALAELLGDTTRRSSPPRDAFEADLVLQLVTLRQELNWCYQQIGRAIDDEGQESTAFQELQLTAQEHEAAILAISRQLQQRGGGDQVGARLVDLARLQQQLPIDTAVIEYYALDDELLAFVITTETVQVVRQLASEALVEEIVAQLRFQTDALRRGVGRRAAHMPVLLRRAQHHLGRLYTLLLQPVLAQLSVTRLAIVPHRALHYVPFPALFDGTRYAVETYEISTAPSAAVLAHCLQQAAPTTGRALFVGVPDARAPRVHDEISAIAPLWEDQVTLLGSAATVAAVQNHARDAAIVHLACHGQFRPDNPLFSALRLADGLLTTRDAGELVLQCGLVVLSACETGVSSLAPGDELIGLVRGFFTAGAPSLIVSLWTVDDTTTAELMVALYRQLRAGILPAAALRQAQRDLLQRHPHPFFWAPFVLMGRW